MAAERSCTLTVSIAAPATAVFELVADPLQLPRWAPGFAPEVRADGDDWVIVTPRGEGQLRVRTSESEGTVDIEPEGREGFEPRVFTRAMAHGSTTEFAFTLLFDDRAGDDERAEQVKIIEGELEALRGLFDR